MFSQLVLIVLLSSLQQGRLQEEGTDDSDLFQNISSSLAGLNSLVKPLVNNFDQFRNEVEGSLASIRADLSSLSHSVSNLSMCLQEHKQQTAAELAQLQTSLNTTQSSLETVSARLDAVTANTAQLSTDHQEIQTSISDVECVDTEQTLQLHQNLQDNLTRQLDAIADGVYAPYTCGGTGGWRRVVNLDMTDPSTTCPSGWQLTGYSKRTCGKSRGSRSCNSATFPVSGGEYTRVCGRIKAYQWGATLAFYSYQKRHVRSIEGPYLSGVSLTHGAPRQHIWSFASGRSEGFPSSIAVCPCDVSRKRISVPYFAQKAFFCESGVNEHWNSSLHYTLHSDDPLWDGENCLPSSTCCSLHNPPFFVQQLPNSTTDNIEARICGYYVSRYENTAVEQVELYVQ